MSVGLGFFCRGFCRRSSVSRLLSRSLGSSWRNVGCFRTLINRFSHAGLSVNSCFYENEILELKSCATNASAKARRVLYDC